MEPFIIRQITHVTLLGDGDIVQSAGDRRVPFVAKAFGSLDASAEFIVDRRATVFVSGFNLVDSRKQSVLFGAQRRASRSVRRCKPWRRWIFWINDRQN